MKTALWLSFTLATAVACGTNANNASNSNNTTSGTTGAATTGATNGNTTSTNNDTSCPDDDPMTNAFVEVPAGTPCSAPEDCGDNGFCHEDACAEYLELGAVCGDGPEQWCVPGSWCAPQQDGSNQKVCEWEGCCGTVCG